MLSRGRAHFMYFCEIRLITNVENILKVSFAFVAI